MPLHIGTFSSKIDVNHITTGHVKALTVRLYKLFGSGKIERMIIECRDKQEALALEKQLHHDVGGNTRALPPSIRDPLFRDLDTESTAYLLLSIALLSSYDGLSDLKLWRRKGILGDRVWNIVSERLQLTDPCGCGH